MIDPSLVSVVPKDDGVDLVEGLQVQLDPLGAGRQGDSGRFTAVFGAVIQAAKAGAGILGIARGDGPSPVAVLDVAEKARRGHGPSPGGRGEDTDRPRWRV